MQWVIVLDTEPPVLVGANNKTVECGSAWSFDPPEASDAHRDQYDGERWWARRPTGACPEVIIGDWAAADACGNTTTCSQTVTNLDLTPAGAGLRHQQDGGVRQHLEF